ncbi:hypothetical protein ACJX0J_012727, partial [Zea mays]
MINHHGLAHVVSTEASVFLNEGINDAIYQLIVTPFGTGSAGLNAQSIVVSCLALGWRPHAIWHYETCTSSRLMDVL